MNPNLGQSAFTEGSATLKRRRPIAWAGHNRVDPEGVGGDRRVERVLDRALPPAVTDEKPILDSSGGGQREPEKMQIMAHTLKGRGRGEIRHPGLEADFIGRPSKDKNDVTEMMKGPGSSGDLFAQVRRNRSHQAAAGYRRPAD